MARTQQIGAEDLLKQIESMDLEKIAAAIADLDQQAEALMGRKRRLLQLRNVIEPPVRKPRGTGKRKSRENGDQPIALKGRRSPEKVKVYSVLEAMGPLRVSEIASQTELDENDVRLILASPTFVEVGRDTFRLKRAGE